MSGWQEGEEDLPHAMRGRVRRTSGPVQEDEGMCVYLHIEETRGALKGTEAPLPFRVSKDLSLSALLAMAEDIVTIEWIPSQIRSLNNGEKVCLATKFHLSRHVHRAYGDGFATPTWRPAFRE